MIESTKFKFEVLYSVIFKALSFCISLALISMLTSGEKFYLELTYLFGLFNMSKILDGGLPYLQRICYAKRRLISRESQIQFSYVMVIIQTALFFLITADVLLSVILGLYGRLYAACNYKLNVIQKSYFLYVANAVPLAISLLAFAFFSLDDSYIFCFSSVFICAALLFFFRKVSFPGFAVATIGEVWNANITFNLLSMLVFFFYAEFSAVFLYGHIPQDDYSQINIFTRIVLLFTGVGSIISTSVWNYSGGRASNIDRVLISPVFYFIPVLISTLIFYGLNTVEVVKVFFGVDVVVYIAVGFCGIISIATLNQSQFLARMEASFLMLLISCFELAGMVLLFFYYKDVQTFLYGVSGLLAVKFFVGSYLCFIILSRRDTVDRSKEGEVL